MPQLLDYSKWHRDATGDVRRPSLSALAFAPMRITTVLDELVDAVGSRAADKGVALRIEACPSVQAVRLRGDAPRLRQVLIALADNAIKFCRPGGAVDIAAVTCMVRRISSTALLAEAADRDGTSRNASYVLNRGASADGTCSDTSTPSDEGGDAAEGCGTTSPSMAQWLRITVADNGVGVPPDQKWRLFKPFSQVAQSSAPGVKPSGSGLGLVISRAIIRERGET